MRILVTGGEGFIGRNLIEELRKDDHKVRTLDPKKHPNSTILNKELVNKMISDSDLVFHLGGSSGCLYFEEPIYACDVNNEGTMNVVDACVKFNVPIIFASTSSFYIKAPIPHKEEHPLTAPNFYSATKIFNEHTIELYSKLSGLNYRIMRFSSVFGANEGKGALCNMISQFVDKVKMNMSPVLFGDGTQTRDFIYVKDVVSALIKAIELPSGTYNVSTMVETSFNDALKLINKVLGKNIRPQYEPLDKKGVHAEYVMRQCLDNSKLKSFEWSPQYTLEEAIIDAYC